jgi:hypothetical protein
MNAESVKVPEVPLTKPELLVVEKPKRGRPKLKEVTPDIEPKIKAKRGRKPLLKVVNEEEKIPKKRGRKPKERFYAVSKEPVIFNIENISDNLLHLEKINKDDFKIESHDIPLGSAFTPYEPYENTFHTIYESPKKEPKHIDFESTDSSCLKLLPELYSSDLWPKTTNIRCWWCCYGFDTIPIPLPKKINNYQRTNTISKSMNPTDIENFEVKGCFCSFNCALAYSNTYNSRNSQYLILFFFKKIYKLNNPSALNEYIRSFSIKPAPPKEVLEIFGGPISISVYRESFHNSTNYNIIDLPSISSKQYIDIIEDKHYKKKKQIDTIVKNSCLTKPVKISNPKIYSKNTLEHLMSMQIIH